MISASLADRGRRERVLIFVSAARGVATAAAASLWAALLLVGLRYEAPPRPPAAQDGGHLRAAADGVRAVGRNADLALIMALAVVQTLTRGALSVLTVVVAIDLLEDGEAGVGLLNGAIGAGAVLGSLAASLLVDTRGLGGWFAVGVALWGAPIMVIGLLPRQGVALGLLACVGAGNALIDLGGFTLLGRIAPDEMLARVFGVLESLVALSMGAGAVITSLAVDLVGVRPTLLAVGLICPVGAVLSWSRLRRMDRSLAVRDREIALLRAVPMLVTLPLPATEQLARGLEALEVPAGEIVVEQGEVGDRYFVIESGAAEVVGDGRLVATLGPGQGFGEIALLRRARRTATVRARGPLRLQTLRSERFLAVVLGYPPSARDAGIAVDSMLERFTPRDGTARGDLDGPARGPAS